MSGRGGQGGGFRGRGGGRYRGGGRGGGPGGDSGRDQQTGGRGGHVERGRGRGRGGFQSGRGGGAARGAAELCRFHVAGTCTRGATCRNYHWAQLAYTGPTVEGRNPVRSIAVSEWKNFVIYGDGPNLNFIGMDPNGQWCPVTSLRQPGEIDSLHVAEFTPEGAAQPLYSLLFVGFSCPVPTSVEPGHYTAVTVGMLKVYDLMNLDPSGAPRETFPMRAGAWVAHKQAITAIDSCVVGPTDPLVVATASLDGTIKLWKPEFVPNAGPTSPQWMSAGLGSDHPAAHVRGITCMRFYGEGPSVRIITGSEDRTVKIWSLSDMNSGPVRTLHPPFATSTNAAGASAPAESGGGAFGRYARAQAAATAGSSDIAVSCLDIVHVFNKSQPVLLVGYSDGHVRCWSLATPDTPQLLEQPQCVLDPETGRDAGKLTAMVALEMPPGTSVEAVVITGYHDGRIIVRDLVEAGLSNPVLTLSTRTNSGHGKEVLDLCGAPGGYFISAGADNKLFLWAMTPDEHTAANE